MADRTRTIIMVLVAVILVMAVLMLYFLIIKPQITGYAVNKQVEGQQIALATILNVVSQCQPFPVQVGNQTVNLFLLECLQQPQQPVQ